MATPFTKRLPAEGLHVVRDDDGQLYVYQVTVDLISWLDEVSVQGRKVYITRDGQVFSDSHKAAEHAAATLGRGDPCSP